MMNATGVVAFALAFSVGTVAPVASDCRIPRSGWALKPVKDGEVGQLYWEPQNYAERWITLRPVVQKPKDQPSAVPEIVLIFSVCFPGKILKPPISTVQIRAQINRNFIPAFAPDPTFEIAMGNQPVSDLARVFPRSTAYPDGCGAGQSCPYEAVIVDVPASLLEQIASAPIVRGNVSGTAFEIRRQQLEWIAGFARLISG